LSLSQPYGAQHDAAFEVLLDIALDLTASLAAADRYNRLLAGVRRVIPCDAACLLRLDGTALVPVAGFGLSTRALARRYERRDHPRLDLILGSEAPVRFPPDSPLADPFDGEIPSAESLHDHVHACLGCPLTEGGGIVGALTADAIEPHRFDALDERVLAMLGALAGAALRTTALIEALEHRADHRRRVVLDLQRTVAQSSGGVILGSSAAIDRLRQEIALVAHSDLAVLISGETGVGKELVANQVHAASARADEALIHVNCAALPVSIAESELFGHIAGAFTGAQRDRAGKFEIADAGTLFLDEIGELPLELQPKLLRALQQGEIQRVGSDRVHRVNVRVIAATNRDLEREVARGRFRADLYHRLAVFPVRVPALRERREDIPVLASHFGDIAARRLGLPGVRMDEAARRRLMEADWPGNVRELENVVSRAVLRAAAGHAGRSDAVTIAPAHLDVALVPIAQGAGLPAPVPTPGGAAMGQGGAAPVPLRDRVTAFERDVILQTVRQHGGNWAAAARALGMHRSNLHHLARRLGLRDTAAGV
jgi:anaerobic nitric oxide reductase transcription regulator